MLPALLRAEGESRLEIPEDGFFCRERRLCANGKGKALLAVMPAAEHLQASIASPLNMHRGMLQVRERRPSGAVNALYHVLGGALSLDGYAPIGTNWT